MTATEKKYCERAAKLNTVAIQNTLATLDERESQEGPSAEFPLGGLVSYQGIGWVSVAALRNELQRREAGVGGTPEPIA